MDEIKKEVPPHIQRFIEAYVSDATKTYADFAQEFDVSKQTIYEWVRDYKSDITTLSNEIADRVRESLIKLGTKAVMTVNELMGDESSSVRLGASNTVLDRISAKKTATDITGNSVPFVLNIVKEGESKSPSGEG